ncbi:hypothetical protein WJX72_000073 [[Myrmecia] bisecta]|uniref:Protein kinase domain-containing protein n=1 Tax=[Myrmecia] bisecta TaxID=41462 RepID=A0AAW1R4I1_9CHLO
MSMRRACTEPIVSAIQSGAPCQDATLTQQPAVQLAASGLPSDDLESRVRFIRKIGEGAFAEAHRCTLASPDPSGNTTVVAVKRLKPAAAASPADLELFSREIAVLRRLNHRNIVRYVGQRGSLGHECWLVQEYIPGLTFRRLLLKQMVNPSKPLYSNVDALRWCLQLADAVNYLHSSRPTIIHRDLNPNNMVLTALKPSQADVKLIDFGLHTVLHSTQHRAAGHMLAGDAHLPPASDCMGTNVRRSLCSGSFSADAVASSYVGMPSVSPFSSNTGTDPCTADAQDTTYYNRGARMHALTGETGAFMYMAPEVMLGQEYNQQIDIFSLGCIMYELFLRDLRMVHVCRHIADTQMLKNYATEVANNARPILPERWPKQLRDLIAACWAQDPTDRPSSAELLKRLQSLQDESVAEVMDAAVPKFKGIWGVFRRATSVPDGVALPFPRKQSL